MNEKLKERMQALKHKLDPFEPVPVCISDVEVGSDEHKRMVNDYNAGLLKYLPLFITDAS